MRSPRRASNHASAASERDREVRAGRNRAERGMDNARHVSLVHGNGYLHNPLTREAPLYYPAIKTAA